MMARSERGEGVKNYSIKAFAIETVTDVGVKGKTVLHYVTSIMNTIDNLHKSLLYIILSVFSVHLTLQHHKS